MKYYPVEENKVLIKSAIEEIFNKHNFTAADKYMAGPGLEGFKQMLNRLFLAFPDIHGTVEHMLAEDNLVVVVSYWAFSSSIARSSNAPLSA